MFEKSGSRTQVTGRSSSRANHYANCSYNWLEYVDYGAKPFAPTTTFFNKLSNFITVISVYKDTLYKDNLGEIWPKPTLLDFGPSLYKDK
jgi:hypothetical protein